MKNKKKKKKRGGSLLVPISLFLLGIGILLYPKFSDWYYRVEQEQVIRDYSKGVKDLSEEEIDRRMDLAKAYNESLDGGGGNLADPFEVKRMEEGREEYARMLEVNEVIGELEIPKILLDTPIYAGVTESVLQVAIGHMPGTSLPIGGDNTHCVLTGHRGLPEVKLFTDLDKLVLGDNFYITNIKETIAYQVDDIKVVTPDHMELMAVVPGHDYVTLLTCTPYMVNSHRLLVRGKRIPYVPAVKEKEVLTVKIGETYKWLFYITLAILILVLYLVARAAWRRKKQEKRRREKELQEKGRR